MSGPYLKKDLIEWIDILGKREFKLYIGITSKLKSKDSQYSYTEVIKHSNYYYSYPLLINAQKLKDELINYIKEKKYKILDNDKSLDETKGNYDYVYIKYNK